MGKEGKRKEEERRRRKGEGEVGGEGEESEEGRKREDRQGTLPEIDEGYCRIEEREDVYVHTQQTIYNYAQTKMSGLIPMCMGSRLSCAAEWAWLPAA